MKPLKATAATALALGILHSAVAHSAVIGTLVFTDPTGTVNGNETITVRVTLTLDAGSDPLTYDPLSAYPSGVNPADIPTEGYNSLGDFVVFDSYDYISAFTSGNCDDTFTVGCGDPGSQYSYDVPGSDSWFDFSGTILPGESLTLNLTTITPIGGGAAPGTYSIYTAGLGLLVQGLDADGNSMDADIYSFLTDCPEDNCTFTRTVTAVPVPAAAWLFGSALFGLAAVARRNKRA